MVRLLITFKTSS